MSAADATGELGEVEERRWRLRVLAAVVAGCLLVLVARLIFIQVVQHDYYAGLAAAERWQRESVPARRGTIRDASGAPLAVSIPVEALYFSPAALRDPTGALAADAARRLAPLLRLPPEVVEARLRSADSPARAAGPVLVAAGLSADAADGVRELRLAGFYLRTQARRAHPQGSLAAQVLGVVGVDGQGLSGLEVALEADLAGEPGWVVAERDTGGDEIALAAREASPPVDGADVTLTLESYVQWVAERELARAVARHGARGGSVVVLDPRSGAVLGLAGQPSLRYDDPELFDESRLALYRVPAADDLYEPGSVFKVVTLAAALEAGALAPDATLFDAGELAYAGGVVRNSVAWPPGPVTLTQVLQRSSNVGAAQAATLLGARRFFEYVAAFGFGAPTGVGLPGDARGLVPRPGQPDWSDFVLATSSFGQGIAVTPLQMAAAVAAVANGGTLLRPYLVAEVGGAAGRRRHHPTIVRQVVRPATARQITEMLVAAVEQVEDGQPRLSRVPGYRVAGKSGTAEVPRGQGYDRQATVASFAGYAPADDPRFVVLVKIDEPQDSPWGEVVAAPVFRAIAQELLLYYRVAPTRP